MEIAEDLKIKQREFLVWKSELVMNVRGMRVDKGHFDAEDVIGFYDQRFSHDYQFWDVYHTFQDVEVRAPEGCYIAGLYAHDEWQDQSFPAGVRLLEGGAGNRADESAKIRLRCGLFRGGSFTVRAVFARR
jgi:hypothetical protein